MTAALPVGQYSWVSIWTDEIVVDLIREYQHKTRCPCPSDKGVEIGSALLSFRKHHFRTNVDGSCSVRPGASCKDTSIIKGLGSKAKGKKPYGKRRYLSVWRPDEAFEDVDTLFFEGTRTWTPNHSRNFAVLLLYVELDEAKKSTRITIYHIDVCRWNRRGLSHQQAPGKMRFPEVDGSPFP